MICQFHCAYDAFMFNSVWPSKDILRHISGPALAQVMTCCLTAPRHYLNQWCLLINEVLQHSAESNCTVSTQVTIVYNELENHTVNIIASSPMGQQRVNTLRPRQNGHFTDDIFKCIFLIENKWISIKISANFVHTYRSTNIPDLVQIMAWRRLGNKPLYASLGLNELRPPFIILLLSLSHQHWQARGGVVFTLIFHESANGYCSPISPVGSEKLVIQ